MKKIICFLVGHDDPVMDNLTGTRADYANRQLYEMWRDCKRDCRRCGKAIRPASNKANV